RRSVQVMRRMIELGKRVVEQTKLRIFRGIVDSKTKIVSVFEPETKILPRGKVHKPTEFGQMVKVQEAEGGIGRRNLHRRVVYCGFGAGVAPNSAARLARNSFASLGAATSPPRTACTSGPAP